MQKLLIIILFLVLKSKTKKKYFTNKCTSCRFLLKITILIFLNKLLDNISGTKLYNIKLLLPPRFAFKLSI